MKSTLTEPLTVYPHTCEVWSIPKKENSVMIEVFTDSPIFPYHENNCILQVYVGYKKKNRALGSRFTIEEDADEDVYNIFAISDQDTQLRMKTKYRNNICLDSIPKESFGEDSLFSCVRGVIEDMYTDNRCDGPLPKENKS